MDNNQITTLSREYADEVYKDEESNPELPFCLMNEMKQQTAEYAEEIIRFILRRFYLVERSTVTESYNYAVNELEEMKGFGSTVSDRYYNEGNLNGKIDLLESLFPELEKEV